MGVKSSLVIDDEEAQEDDDDDIDDGDDEEHGKYDGGDDGDDNEQRSSCLCGHRRGSASGVRLGAAVVDVSAAALVFMLVSDAGGGW